MKKILVLVAVFATLFTITGFGQKPIITSPENIKKAVHSIGHNFDIRTKEIMYYKRVIFFWKPVWQDVAVIQGPDCQVLKIYPIVGKLKFTEIALLIYEYNSNDLPIIYGINQKGELAYVNRWDIKLTPTDEQEMQFKKVASFAVKELVAMK